MMRGDDGRMIGTHATHTNTQHTRITTHTYCVRRPPLVNLPVDIAYITGGPVDIAYITIMTLLL